MGLARLRHRRVPLCSFFRRTGRAACIVWPAPEFVRGPDAFGRAGTVASGMATMSPKETVAMKQTDMSRTARAGGYAVQTAGLTKRFGGRTAVDRVDLPVPAGTAFGYLAPNGAGKTTLIRMLLGLTAATSGSMRLLGHLVPAERSAALLRVGAMAEEPRFLDHLTGRENLRINAAAREPAARGRIEEALERAGLAGRAGERVARYSAGLRHRPRQARLRRLDRHQPASCVSAAPFMAPVFVKAPGVSAHAGPGPGEGSL